MQEDGLDQFSRTRSSMKVDLKLLAKQVSTNRLHTPWYMEQREGECASGCDDVDIMHCITCVSSFCTKCSEEHSKESQSHRLVPYEEKHKKKVCASLLALPIMTFVLVANLIFRHASCQLPMVGSADNDLALITHCRCCT